MRDASWIGWRDAPNNFSSISNSRFPWLPVAAVYTLQQCSQLAPATQLRRKGRAKGTQGCVTNRFFRAAENARAKWHNVATMIEDRWPALPYDAWKDTYATLHMWAQIVGKVALAFAPPLNHCWAIALHVTARGLATRSLPQTGRFFTLEFDLISHRLFIRTSDGVERTMELKPRSVADFYRELMANLSDIGLGVKIWSMQARSCRRPCGYPIIARRSRDARSHFAKLAPCS